MRIDARKKIGDIVYENPTANQILKNLGIDSFHNSHRSLWDVCTNAGILVSKAVEELKLAEETGRQTRKFTNNKAI